jgi:hypothetical protein
MPSQPVLTSFDAAAIETDDVEPVPHWSELPGAAPRIRRDAGFRALLAPHDEATFVTEYLGRRWLYAPAHGRRHVHRAILTLDELLAGIATRRVPPDQVSFMNGVEGAPPDRFATDNFLVASRARPAIAVARLRDYLTARRGSLVAFGLEHAFSSVWDFMAGVGEVTGSITAANAYYTPRGGRVFTPHWDTHDVLVVQLHGAKRWRVYDVVLAHPLQGRGYMESNPYAGFADDLAYQDLTLREGDLLYLPAGTPHAAWCEDSDSLHLTGALLPPRWHDVLAAMTREALLECEKELALRRPCPAWFVGAGDPRVQGERTAAIERLVEHLRAVALEPVLDRYFAAQLPAPRAITLDASAIGLATPLERAPVVAFVHLRDAHVELVFLERRIEFSRHVAPALAWLLERRSACAADLPELDDVGRLALVRRLVEEGFLHPGTGPELRADDSPRQGDRE